MIIFFTGSCYNYVWVKYSYEGNEQQAINHWYIHTQNTNEVLQKKTCEDTHRFLGSVSSDGLTYLLIVTSYTILSLWNIYRFNSCYNLWQIIPKALAGSLEYRQTGWTSRLWDGSIMNKWTNTSLRKVLTPTSSTPHPKDNDITPHTTPRGQSYWTPPHLFVSSHYWDSSLLWTISEHAHLHKLKCEHVAIWITCLYFLLITYVHIV